MEKMDLAAMKPIYPKPTWIEDVSVDNMYVWEMRLWGYDLCGSYSVNAAWSEETKKGTVMWVRDGIQTSHRIQLPNGGIAETQEEFKELAWNAICDTIKAIHASLQEYVIQVCEGEMPEV